MGEGQKLCSTCGGLLSSRCIACEEATRPDPDRHLFGCVMVLILLLLAVFGAGVWTGTGLL